MPSEADENSNQIPKGDEAREAVDALRGYLYQALASGIAWVRLPENGRLYLEVADDYATLINNKLTSVQVKDTQQSGSITLNTQGVKDAIRNFVKLVKDNPQLNIQQHYLSTSPIGKEKKREHQIAGMAGLEYWRDAAASALVHPLRTYLESDRVDITVKTFCENRKDDQLRTELVSRMSWHVGQPGYEGLIQDLENELIEFGHRQKILAPSEAAALAPVIVYAVLKCSIKPDRRQRVLTRADLLSTIETVTSVSVPKQQIRDLLRQLPSIENPLHAGKSWQKLNFEASRGWRPALLGQALVPADALTCPQLQEVEIIINRLQRDYLVNILGEPGSGKSICAFQVANHFHQQGWEVLQQFSSAQLELPTAASSNTLYLVDDAHLLQIPTMQALVQLAGKNRFFLFLHNALKDDFRNAPRQALYINARRAVGEIASYMRSHQAELLSDVRSLDSDVGLRTVDTSLEYRIDEAEKEAQYPWQFCFIVSGGWRRALESVEAAQSLGAELSMAAVAIYQLVSRDARPSKEVLQSITEGGKQPNADLESHLQWMFHQRLLIGPHDLRFPHQRFASVVLRGLLKRMPSDVRCAMGAMLAQVMANPVLSLLGKRNLFSELHFDNWHRLVPAEALSSPIKQCWSATTQNEITHAAYFVAETDDYIRARGIPLAFENQTHLVRWLNSVTPESAYALSHLLNRLTNRDEDLTKAIIARTDAIRLGKTISAITPKSASSFGSFLGCLGVAKEIKWGQEFIEAMDREQIQTAISEWTGNSGEQDGNLLALSSANTYIKSLQWVDENFALSLCENLAPFVQRVWRAYPVQGFNCFDDVCWFLLRFFDAWKLPDNYQPEERHFRIANLFLSEIDVLKTAEELSNAPLADFHASTYFLSFVRKVNPPLFELLTAAMNWNTITQTIGEHWSALPHEAEILLGVCWAESTQLQIEQAVKSHVLKVEALPSRLALMFPAIAWNHLEASKPIDLIDHWQFGAGVIAMTADENPDLLEGLIERHLIQIADRLSRVQQSQDIDTIRFLTILSEASPTQWEELLKAIDIPSASTIWRKALSSNGKTSSVPSFLIDSCLDRDDDLGELVRALDLEFPNRTTKDQLMLALKKEDQTELG